MKYIKIAVILLVIIIGGEVKAAEVVLPSLHSHNDYLQQAPFWSAYSAGCKYIEVDIHLKGGNLYVAHDADKIHPEKSFYNLYIAPLERLFRENGNILTPQNEKLTLFVDIKSEAEPTLKALVKELSKYPYLFNKSSITNSVGVVISGNRPAPSTYSDYPEYIQFDATSVDVLDKCDPARVATVSGRFKDFTVWNGKGRIVEEERLALKEFIDAAHKHNKPVRFWSAPESQTTYRKLFDLGVDIINTDIPYQAAEYYRTFEKSTKVRGVKLEPYKPLSDKFKNRAPQNIILFIGDGMGTNHLMAAYTVNGGELTITNLPNTGLMTTHAKDNYGTDSAAAGTALATGVITNNRAIGVDPDGNELLSMVDLFAAKGMRTGIITTDRICGATPSAYFGHTPERDDKEKILDDLMDSPLNYLVGYGYDKDTDSSIKSRFSKKEGTVDNLREVYLLEESVKSNAYSSTTADLAIWTKKAIEKLECKEGFFLMIECSGIDGGGHLNKTEQIVNEVLNLDSGVAEAIKFADLNRSTLVVVTADHETGGLSLPEGDYEKGEIEGRFYSNDHTGGAVPYFTYGPNSDLFHGLIKNTDIKKIIIKSLK